jgi:uncharacterized protein with PIN domain
MATDRWLIQRLDSPTGPAYAFRYTGVDPGPFIGGTLAEVFGPVRYEDHVTPWSALSRHALPAGGVEWAQEQQWHRCGCPHCRSVKRKDSPRPAVSLRAFLAANSPGGVSLYSMRAIAEQFGVIHQRVDQTMRAMGISPLPPPVSLPVYHVCPKCNARRETQDRAEVPTEVEEICSRCIAATPLDVVCTACGKQFQRGSKEHIRNRKEVDRVTICSDCWKGGEASRTIRKRAIAAGELRDSFALLKDNAALTRKQPKTRERGKVLMESTTAHALSEHSPARCDLCRPARSVPARYRVVREVRREHSTQRQYRYTCPKCCEVLMAVPQGEPWPGIGEKSLPKS